MRRVIGIGLVALDVVIDDATGERLGAWAGGSCGNVLSILAWMGWDAAPVARLGDERTARLVRADLRRWKIDERWLSLGSPAPAPVFVERLVTGPAALSHIALTDTAPCAEAGCRAIAGGSQRARAGRRHLGAGMPCISTGRPPPRCCSPEQPASTGSSSSSSRRRAAPGASRGDRCRRSIVKYSSERLNREDRDLIAPPLRPWRSRRSAREGCVTAAAAAHGKHSRR